MVDLASALLSSYKRKSYPEMLAEQASSTAPGNWAVALSRALQGAMAGYFESQDNTEQKKAIDALPGLSQQPNPQALGAALQPSPESDKPMDTYAKATSGIESGGRYDALGPVTKSGDRAYGKYQVMGANVGPWSKQYLGQEMTPDQFLKNPQAQDAVYNGQFGKYVSQYGPEGAARAWFAGEGGMNDPNRKDQLGTSVAQYGQKFAQAAGLPPGGQSSAMPSAAPPMNIAPSMPAQNPVQPGRQTPRLDPAEAAQIRQMLMSNDPQTKMMGMTLYQQRMTPKEQWLPLTDPAERARRGISPEDKNPYEYNSLTNQVKAVNPQPFAVNVKNQNESAFEKTYGEGMGKEALNTIDAGNKASLVIQRIPLMRALNEAIQTGKLTESKATIGAWAKAININPASLSIDPDLPANAETFRSLSNEMVLGKIGGAGGMPANNFSDADRKFLQQIQSSLSDQPQANEMKMVVAERVAKLSEDKANAWVDARDNGKSYEQFDREWRKQLRTQNIFGDLSQSIMQGSQTQPAASGSVRRYNPATGRIE